MARSELTPDQRVELDLAIRRAESSSRVEFSVFVGDLTDAPRDLALRMHAVMAAPDTSVLVAVDPRARAIEVVTGASVRSRVGDDEVRTVVQQLGKAFAAGDRFGGLVRAVEALAARASR